MVSKGRSAHRVGNLAKQGEAAVFSILRLSIVKRVDRRKRKGNKKNEVRKY